MNDPVYRPRHYTAGPVEVVEILEQAVAHAPGPVPAALQWQALKYLHRLWLKGSSLQDAEKASWYLGRLIAYLRTVEPAVKP